MNATLLSLAMSFTLAQAELPAAPTAAEAPAPARPATPAEAPHGAEGAVEGRALLEGRGEAGAHEGQPGHAEHDESLGGVMMGHVADGYQLEFPGICRNAEAGANAPREFRWNCEIDLRESFGKSLVFHVGGTTVDLTPTKHVVMLWIGAAILLLTVLLAVRKRSLVPRGLYNFIEMLVQFVRNEIAAKNIGEHDADRFVPYLASAFFFILFLNLLGLVPFAATATANLSVTMAMATFTFLITQYAAIRAMGLGGFLSHLTGGVHWLLWPIMVPVEVLGLFTKPFALTVRLFANMVAGHFVILALLGLIYALNSQWVAFGSVPMALGIFMLELFVALVQAYIFTMLSALFIGAGLAHHGAEHAHAEEKAHAEPGMGSEHNGSHVAGASPGHG